MTRPEASTRILALAAPLRGLAGDHLTEAAHVLVSGNDEQRANVTRGVARMALVLEISEGPEAMAARAYVEAAQIADDVTR